MDNITLSALILHCHLHDVKQFTNPRLIRHNYTQSPKYSPKSESPDRVNSIGAFSKSQDNLSKSWPVKAEKRYSILALASPAIRWKEFAAGGGPSPHGSVTSQRVVEFSNTIVASVPPLNVAVTVHVSMKVKVP